MCGFIAGQNETGFSTLKIEESLQLLNHRGPDSHAVSLLKNNAFMAHARLAIVGLADGAQPLHSNGISIVVNGEFYEHQRLRTSLQDKGFNFQTHSDSEVLLYLYQLYGAQALDHLHGEFAFVLYDSQKNIWFAARDRFGIRPLNILKENNRFMFASEAKAFMPHTQLRLSKNNVVFTQHFQYLPQNETVFENVHMLPPAHFLWLEAPSTAGGSSIQNYVWKEVCYWRPTETNTTDSLSVAKDKIEALLSQAVSRRIPQEVKACVHLSGGLDSSSIAYLARSHGVKDAFTISFTDDSFYNELEFAQKTATKLDMNLHAVEVSFKDILTSIPKAIYHAEGLSINGHLGGKYLLNKAIHEAGFKVALSGEGSDEVFMGYSHLKQDYLSKESLNTMERSYLAGHQLPSGAMLNLQEIEAQLGFVPTWLQAKSSMAHKFSGLWSEHTASLAQSLQPNAWFLKDAHTASNLGHYSKLKQSSFLWSRYCLAGYILKVLDDAQAMAFSVEGRLPFLDTDFASYVLSLPEEYYFEGNIEKNILRQIMRHHLPAEITQKTKQSFMSPPLTKSLKDDFSRGFIKDLLFNSNFESQGLFNPQKLEAQLKVWEDNPTPDSEPILMTLLCWASLCQEYKL